MHLWRRSARGVEISGEPQLVSKVQGILQNMNSIGTSCVLGKGIKKYLHNKLLHKEEKLFLGFLEENKVMVFFPSSGGYGTIRMPDNMSQLKKDGWPSEEIVKIVGATADDCKRAEILLEVGLSSASNFIRLNTWRRSAKTLRKKRCQSKAVPSKSRLVSLASSSASWRQTFEL